MFRQRKMLEKYVPIPKHRTDYKLLLIILALMLWGWNSILWANTWTVSKMETVKIERYDNSIVAVQFEIIKQAHIYNVDVGRALDLADCESDFNWKAKNPNSTARGIFQFIISTWEETDSAKQGLERNDYKANIKEAMIAISNGKAGQWNDHCKF